MKRNINVYVVCLCFWMIAGVPFGSMAAGIPAPPSRLAIGLPDDLTEPIPPPAPVTPAGNDGLLSGQTPANYRLPTGWTLLRTTDFEGTKPTGENWSLWQASLQTDIYHGGSKSLGGTYSAGQHNIGWLYASGQIGTFSEVYLSYYDYTESTALFNDEYWMAQFYKYRADGSFLQEIILDWMWPGGFNKPYSSLWIVPQGVRSKRFGPKGGTVPKGAWHQWEIHYRPNTTTGGVANSNGFYRVYLDGTLYLSTENANLNGTADMSNMGIRAGGLYTKAVWMTDYPTCSVPSGCGTAPGNGTDLCTNPKGWASQSFANPICNPIDPPLPSFKRRIDDIILMKK